MLPARLNGADDHREHGWTLLNVPSFRCSPDRDGTLSPRAVIIDMDRRLALVLGRADYCGVNKKTKRMHEHRARCVLLNTGWSGGAYGSGRRMSLAVTRRLLNAALSGEFDDVDTRTHPVLGLRMPVSCKGVDDRILDPGSTWEVPDAYDAAARRLRDMFRTKYEEQGYAQMGIAAAM